MTWVQIPLDIDFSLLNFTWFIKYSRETFNINLRAAHYNTNHVDRGTKIEGCDAHACWKQNKTINYGDKVLHTQSRDLLITRSFQLYAPLLVILQLLRGDP